MEELRPEEEVELNREEFIVLRFGRVWPHHLVEWTRRRKSTEGSSFPLRSGAVRTTDNPPDWESLRSQALVAAEAISTPDQGARAYPGNWPARAGDSGGDAPSGAITRFFSRFKSG